MVLSSGNVNSPRQCKVKNVVNSKATNRRSSWSDDVEKWESTTEMSAVERACLCVVGFDLSLRQPCKVFLMI